MAFGAASRRGASQPATDGSQTAGASRAPSGASLVEGHLTKHWDGDDKVGGAHQAVTDADKKSDDAGHSPAAAAAATASAGPFGTRVGRLTQGRLNLTQVRRQRTTVRPTRRKNETGLWTRIYLLVAALDQTKNLRPGGSWLARRCSSSSSSNANRCWCEQQRRVSTTEGFLVAVTFCSGAGI